MELCPWSSVESSTVYAGELPDLVEKLRCDLDLLIVLQDETSETNIKPQNIDTFRQASIFHLAQRAIAWLTDSCAWTATSQLP